MLKRLTLPLAVLVFAAAPLDAQTKNQMLADWTRLRETVLAYIDAMPDSAMTFHPTAGVRTFGEQIIHNPAINFEVAPRVLRAANTAPATPDTATTPKQKAALRDFADKSFAYVIDAIR